jgi:hypothetical protein
MGERALTQEALTQAVITYLEGQGLEYTLSGRRLKIIKTTKDGTKHKATVTIPEGSDSRSFIKLVIRPAVTQLSREARQVVK